MLLAFIARLQKRQSKRYFVTQSSSKPTKNKVAMCSSVSETKVERKTMVTLGLKLLAKFDYIINYSVNKIYAILCDSIML